MLSSVTVIVSLDACPTGSAILGSNCWKKHKQSTWIQQLRELFSIAPKHRSC